MYKTTRALTDFVRALAYWLLCMGRRDRTASPAQPRVTTGSIASGRSAGFFAEKNMTHCARVSRHTQMTANAPQLASFMIASFFSRVWCDESASTVSR